MADEQKRTIEEPPDLLVNKADRPRVAQGGIRDAYAEIGVSGLRQYGGFVQEEWLTQLAGRRAAWVWREMQDNDPTVGAILFAIKWLVRGVDWRVEAGKEQEAAEFVEECMHDMSHTWGDFVSDALSFLPYGWSLHEEVYKKRLGYQPDPPMVDDAMGKLEEDDSNRPSSMFNDGKIGWRKLPVRAQETMLRWLFNGYSGLRGMEQIDYHGGTHYIPLAKSMLFRTQKSRNNPEGRSILRNAYTSYMRLKGIQQIEGIGVERDLAGIPVVTPPPDIDLFSPGNATLLGKVQDMVTGVRRDEYEGIVLPSAGWKFELVHSGGTRQIDTDKVARRYRADIAASMLADFVLLGQDAVGSYAMVDIKSDLFGIAIDAILDLMCEVVNRYSIPRLLRLNGFDVSEPPEIHHGSAGRIDLERVGTFLFQLAGSGAPIPWTPSMLQALFKAAALPANFQTGSSDTPMVPVQPPKLPEGSDPYAREPTMQPASTVQAQPAKPDGKTSPSKQPRKPAAKADPKPPSRPVEKAASVDVSGALQRQHIMLSAQLENDINWALGLLGEQAATALSSVTLKASSPFLQRIVTRVLRAMNLPQWVEQHLRPLLRNHVGRVAEDTQRTLRAEINLEIGLADAQVQQLEDRAGEHLSLRDIEPQVRQAVMQAVRDGIARGEHPTQIADRIRADVPSGRFVNAGARYRARLIAREETATAQREAALALYENNPNVVAVELRDGIFGPPRSDSTCIERSGDVVPISEARTVHPFHPQCTLMYLPVVAGQLSAG